VSVEASGRPVYREVSPRQIYFRRGAAPFWGIHLIALAGVGYCGLSWSGLALALGAYFVRMVVVTAGYHRYFSHRSFKTSRVFQFLLAFAAQSTAQKGVLWWASHHRWHHRHSDTPQDVHSVQQRGFWYAHLGWILGPDNNDTRLELVADLAKYPELRFLNRPSVQLLPALVYALACLALGGIHGLVWGFFVSTVLLWHGTFTINSLAHLFGRRRYATSDDSRNSLALALLTTGEGWHNNHHRYQSSARQGFRWWEVDVTYYVLRLLAAVGLIWDLRRVPPEALNPESVSDPTPGSAAGCAAGQHASASAGIPARYATSG
jgi:stearoyl-CoA desaturase (Delta-9 desaturase)